MMRIELTTPTAPCFLKDALRQRSMPFGANPRSIEHESAQSVGHIAFVRDWDIFTR